MVESTSASEDPTTSGPDVVVVQPDFEFFRTFVWEGEPGDKRASYDGHGTAEALEVTKILENAGITCCLVGVSALNYYGADRVRRDWEVCVPTEHLDRAAAIFMSPPYSDIYVPRPGGPPAVESLLHTFPRFKQLGLGFWFVLVPSLDCHLHESALWATGDFERSRMGLPYPPLAAFAQALLEACSMVDLTDLVDGMDVTEEWGEANLELEGTVDVEWARAKNERMQAARRAAGDRREVCFLDLPAEPYGKRETWVEIVRGKTHRIGVELPKEYFVTRFRAKGSGDPRLREDRVHA